MQTDSERETPVADNLGQVYDKMTRTWAKMTSDTS